MSGKVNITIQPDTLFSADDIQDIVDHINDDHSGLNINPDAVSTGCQEEPKPTLTERLDDLIYSDCDTCRTLRLGIFIGSMLTNIIMAGLIIVIH